MGVLKVKVGAMELSGSRSLPQLSYGRTHLLSSSSSSSSSTQERCSESPMEGEGCLEGKKSINVIWGRGINEKGKCVMKVRSRSSSFDEPDYCSSRDQSIFNCYSIYERQSEEIEKTSLNKMVVKEIEAFELASGDSSNIFHNSKGSEVEAIGKLWQSSEGESSGGLKKNTASGSFQGEFTGREARRNNIRRLWDALFHRSPSLEASVNDGLNSLGFEDSRRPFNHNMGQSGNSLEEGRNRFMVWAFQRHSKVSVKESCPSRCHSNGQCNCETYVVEETNTGTLLSRIANLVKILSQVLDEILCESTTIAWLPSFSLGPLPAPDLIVNSLPVHIHKNPPGANQDDGQCYICFSDYIDGDELRTLPCSHQYHVDCVDKWLKEVHRVCPLCRSNVCESYVDILC